MKYLLRIFDKQDCLFFIKYFSLFTMLFISIAMAALTLLMKDQINPFFYIQF